MQYLSSEQDTSTTLHVHHMIFTSFLSQLFLTLLSLVTVLHHRSLPLRALRALSEVLENARRDRRQGFASGRGRPGRHRDLLRHNWYKLATVGFSQLYHVFQREPATDGYYSNYLVWRCRHLSVPRAYLLPTHVRSPRPTVGARAVGINAPLPNSIFTTP